MDDSLLSNMGKKDVEGDLLSLNPGLLGQQRAVLFYIRILAYKGTHTRTHTTYTESDNNTMHAHIEREREKREMFLTIKREARRIC